MRRPVSEHSEPVNGDSFLDIVASVVSIMIIMVVMEGSRIKNAPVNLAIPASPAAVATGKGPGRRAIAPERRVEVGRRDQRLGAGNRCPRHATRLAGDSGFGRGTEDSGAAATARRRQAGRTSISPAISRNRGSQLEQLVGQRQQVENTPAAPVVVESYPTPISRAVDGPEAHFLITNGRVVFVPIEPLLEQFQTQARAAGLQASRSAGVDRHRRAGGRFSAPLHDGALRRRAGACPRRQPRRQLRPATEVDADSRVGRSGRAGAIGVGGRAPTFATPWRRSCRAGRPSPSGSIPTVSTPFARFARNCTGWATRLPPGRCPPARPSAARRMEASRRPNSLSCRCSNSRPVCYIVLATANRPSFHGSCP